MSFVGTPANFRMDVQYLDWDVFWFDRLNHLRLVRWSPESSSREYCIVDTDNLTPALLVDGNRLDFQAGLVNGQPFFSDGNRYVFLSADGYWILHSSLSEPRAYQLANGGAWKGDGWWLLSGFYPIDIETPPTLLAQGLYQNAGDAPTTAPVVAWSWPRWIRDASASGSSVVPFGVYVANETGLSPVRRTVGCLRFREAPRGGYWVESLDGKRFVQTTFRGTQTLSEKTGGIWATDGWSATAAGSWKQASSRPTRDGGATLVPMKRDADGEQPHADGEPVELAFVDYVSSGETESIHVAEVALWR